MGELASAPAILLIGNDATEQNPLVAWQIRAAIRHHGSRLYIVDSREQKLRPQGAGLRADSRGARSGRNRQALRRRRRARGCAGVRAGPAAARLARRAGRRKRSGRSLRRGASRRRARSARGNSRKRAPPQGKRTRFMALGDYANSRGAADMGLLPDRLPGYASVANSAGARSFRPSSGARRCRKAAAWTRAPCSTPRSRDSSRRCTWWARIPRRRTNLGGSRALRQARSADRAGPVPFGNGAPGRYRFAGAFRLTKKTAP